MRWNSEWSDGFPGWHLECSVMSTKYLGDKFDIHGGGLDLQFPHHECEIAQSKAALGEDSVKYWMHNNLITIDGQKMSKSLGNFITLDEMFSGNHKLLEQAYSPMVVRFFMLQAHYRSTLDFSNKALQASQKGYERLTDALNTLEKLIPRTESTVNVNEFKDKLFSALDDDLNTPILIAHLFDGVKMINSIYAGTETISTDDLTYMKNLYKDIVFDILGLKHETSDFGNNEILTDVMDLLLNIRTEAKQHKDFKTSDKIRDKLNEIGITVKDTKDGSEWEIK
jgi:cysteinyl-tRNA synthetase